MEEIEKLIAGFNEFRKRHYAEQPEFINRLIRKRQSPRILIIACCDSRVHPETILNTRLGDIFVIRNIANIVPVYNKDSENLYGTGAAIEFAVTHLGVRHIIVFGHSQCGGIRSLIEGKYIDANYDFIDRWMATLAPVRERILDEFADSPFNHQCHRCELAGIEFSLNNLRDFPWIRNKTDEGSLFIHGWYFDIGLGKLLKRDDKSRQFIPLETTQPIQPGV